ncbi:MAG: restriction endonuclease [Acidobacteria bacterium]|nr:restriction endonuclease [Acidobacteriota bacterium]MBI3471541.1 restriction endonuclease [Candidatus Solibacter usitatus]
MASEPKVPTFDALMWPALQAMKELGGSATHEELLEKVIELRDIPEAVQNVMHTERQTKIGYNLAWAKTYLGKGGALENPSHGVWAITEKGKGLTEAAVKQIPVEVRKQYRLERDNKKPKVSQEEEDLQPETKNWKDELLAVLTQMTPDAFERLAQRILRESGFVKVEVTGRSGDGGIDGVGVLRLSLLSFQVYFQCKKYKGSVSPGAIRDFRGAMVGRSDKGLFITTGTFTAEAKKEATRDGAPAIDLIDGDILCDLLKNLKLGIATKMVEEVSIDPQWFSKI